jgi:hypothetical protein
MEVMHNEVGEERTAFRNLRRDIWAAIDDAVRLMWSPPRPGAALKVEEHPYYIIDNGISRTLEIWSGHPNKPYIRALHRTVYSKVRHILVDGQDRYALSTYGYYDYFLPLRHLYNDEPNTLLLGFGGGVMPCQWKTLHGIDVKSVEIDSKIIDLAPEFLPAAERMAVINRDGADYIAEMAASGTKYDVIMQDVSVGMDVPEPFLARDFASNVRAALEPDGIFAANYYMGLRGFLNYGRYVKALGREFNVYRMNVNTHNVILLCSSMGRKEILGRLEENTPADQKEMIPIDAYRQMARA